MRAALLRIFIAAWVCIGVSFVASVPRAQFGPPPPIITSSIDSGGPTTLGVSVTLSGGITPSQGLAVASWNP